jgi:hypothetical protein
VAQRRLAGDNEVNALYAASSFPCSSTRYAVSSIRHVSATSVRRSYRAVHHSTQRLRRFAHGKPCTSAVVVLFRDTLTLIRMTLSMPKGPRGEPPSPSRGDVYIFMLRAVADALRTQRERTLSSRSLSSGRGSPRRQRTPERQQQALTSRWQRASKPRNASRPSAAAASAALR